MNEIRQTINGRKLVVRTKQRVNIVGQDEFGYSRIQFGSGGHEREWIPMPATPWVKVEKGFVGTVIAEGWTRDFDGKDHAE